jgi:copper chaperone CopZ
MKTIKALFVIAFAVAITSVAKAQNFNYKLDGPFVATKTISVSGVCDVCKHRIENAVNKLPGIWSSSWDEASKTLLVKYDRAKVNPDKIQQAIAAAGHDTEKFKASAEVYTALPQCCHYQRTKA